MPRYPRIAQQSATVAGGIVGTGGTALTTTAGIATDPALSATYVPLAGAWRQRRIGVPAANRCWVVPGPYKVQNSPGTSKTSHFTGASASADLVLAYGAWTQNSGSPYGDIDLTNASALPVRAGIEYPAGTINPVFFNGARTGSLDNGGLILSDPIGVDIPPNTQFWVRTYVNPATGDYWPQASNTTANTEGEGWAASDLTAAGAAAIARSDSYAIRPLAIFGRTASGRSLGIVGDSIAAGVGDLFVLGGAAGAFSGFICRAANPAGIPWVSIAVAGEQGARFLTSATGHVRRGPLINGCSSIICQYGVNDLQSALTPTFSGVTTSLAGIWRYLAARGSAVWQTTITPNSTSTDGWITTANQTISTVRDNTVRTAVNAWILAGGPLDPATMLPVAVGTSGAIVAGQSSHPLAGIWDVAAIVETTPGSGIWKVGAMRTVSDAAISGTTVTSATAAFTTADVGTSISIAGAGSAGAALTTNIASRTSATQVKVTDNAGTNVSGAAASIGQIYTGDGLHPLAFAHAAMAAVIDTTKLV